MTTPDEALKQHAEVKKVLSAIVLRAWQNSDFADLLVKDPDKALSEANFKLPADLAVTFYQDTPSHVHYVIPASPASDLKDNIDYHLARLSQLHVEVTSTTSWVQKPEM